ncbi:hypothetical protein C8R44DRAFT_879843 [Mycena epipterygia]|nr:hypothetical protein C8R44DRAFT_879843 [Mycena epipterygia]
MHLLWVVVLLAGAVRAGLTNYTIDDMSPSIVYSHIPLERCTSTTCGGQTSSTYNGTATLTDGPITFSFTGSELYVIGAMFGICTFGLDGNTVGTLNLSVIGENADLRPIYTNTSIPDGPHTLVITPLTDVTVIWLDYLIYTANSPRKTHVGAIVGGVIGGLVLTVGVFFAAFFIRRRKNRKRLFLRGIPLGDEDKASIKLTPIAGKN